MEHGSSEWVKAIMGYLMRLDPYCSASDVAGQLGVSKNTVYRWRGEGCDNRTALALECLVRREIERQADRAQKELDEIRVVMAPPERGE